MRMREGGFTVTKSTLAVALTALVTMSAIAQAPVSDELRALADAERGLRRRPATRAGATRSWNSSPTIRSRSRRNRRRRKTESARRRRSRSRCVSSCGSRAQATSPRVAISAGSPGRARPSITPETRSRDTAPTCRSGGARRTDGACSSTSASMRPGRSRSRLDSRGRRCPIDTPEKKTRRPRRRRSPTAIAT